jgi:RecA-family ATPase
MLAAAHVLSRDWFGSMPEPGPVIYFSTEDDADEMHRRFAHIAKHYDASLADLASGLHLLDYVGKDAVLGSPNSKGIIRPTRLLERLREAACDINLDSSSSMHAPTCSPATRMTGRRPVSSSRCSAA